MKIFLCVIILVHASSFVSISGLKYLPFAIRGRDRKFNLVKRPILSTRVLPERSVGIDLGTTYSAVSYITDNGKPEIISIEGKRLLPSIVAFTAEGLPYVGQAAISQSVCNPSDVFSSTKRMIGKSFSEASTSNLCCNQLRPYCQIQPADSDEVRFKCSHTSVGVSPTEIAALIIAKLLSCAQTFFQGSHIDHAVVTIPAYFGPAQCRSTEQAALRAGLKKVKLLREPEAAALAYGLGRESPQIILVVDLGGGTLDVSVLEVGSGLIEVIATSGDPQLGGDDYNRAIIDWLHSEIANRHGKELASKLRSNPLHARVLLKLVEEAKVALTSAKSTTIVLPADMLTDQTQDMDASFLLTQSRFEVISRPLNQRVLRTIREVALMAGVNLTGESGMASSDAGHFISKSQDEDTDADFDICIKDNAPPKGPLDLSFDLKSMKKQQRRQNPMRNQKAAQSIKQQLQGVKKATGFSSIKRFPGGQQLSEVLLVGGATRMPMVRTAVQVLAGVQPRFAVHPDEAVCLGAAVMAGILDGTVKGLQVVSTWQSALLRMLKDNKDIVLK